MAKYVAHAEATREAIRAALEGLLEEGDFEDITMAHLAQRAGMNRSTIYHYYASLYEVLGDCIYQYAGKADQNVPQADDPCFWDVVRDNFVKSARDIAAHGRLYNLLYRYPSEFPADSPHVIVLKQHSDVYHRLLVDQLLLRYPACRVPRAYLEIALARMSGGVLGAWIDGGCAEPLDEYADHLLLMSKAVVDAVMAPAPGDEGECPRAL